MKFEQKLETIKNKDSKASKIAFYIALLFTLIYLISIDNIILSNELIGFDLSSNWKENLFKERVSFLWEPIATLSILKLSLLISIPNLIISFLLGILVYLNVLVAVFSYRIPKTCGLRPHYTGILGFLPAALTGFACCAPTFLLALGPLASAGLTLLFIDIRPFLIPASVILMLLSLYYMIKKVPDSVF